MNLSVENPPSLFIPGRGAQIKPGGRALVCSNAFPPGGHGYYAIRWQAEVTGSCIVIVNDFPSSEHCSHGGVEYLSGAITQECDEFKLKIVSLNNTSVSVHCSHMYATKIGPGNLGVEFLTEVEGPPFKTAWDLLRASSGVYLCP